MNINTRTISKPAFDARAKESGVGANALWDGPLDLSGLAKGKGYSAGSTGIILNNDKPMSCGCPITKKAKGMNNGGY